MAHPLFIETLRLFNGQLSNVRFHNERMYRTQLHHFEEVDITDLASVIVVPQEFTLGLFKCRVTYGHGIERIEFEPYHPRTIQSLRLIEVNDIEYSFKYQNRSDLNTLSSQKGEADDVLIIKHGNVTDTSYANIVFWDGQQWTTPSTFLLAGTQRAHLLEQGTIVEKKIRAEDLPKYVSARIINSMLDFEVTPAIPMSSIR